MPKYQCGFCGATYDDVNNYVKCVNICKAKEDKSAEDALKKKLKEEKNARLAEINSAANDANSATAKLRELIKKFDNDYPYEASPLPYYSLFFGLPRVYSSDGSSIFKFFK